MELARGGSSSLSLSSSLVFFLTLFKVLPVSFVVHYVSIEIEEGGIGGRVLTLFILSLDHHFQIVVPSMVMKLFVCHIMRLLAWFKHFGSFLDPRGI